MALKQALISQGNTQIKFEPEGGTPLLYWTNEITEPTFDVVTTLFADINDSVLQFVAPTGILTAGDLVKINDEILPVTTVTPIVTEDTIDVHVRGFEGTLAAAHLAGATVCKVGEFTFVDDGGPVPADDPIILIDPAQGITPVIGDIFRRETTRPIEWLLVDDISGGDTVTFERNFTQNGLEAADRILDAIELLVKIYAGFNDPEDDTKLLSWGQIESLEGVTFTKSRENIDLETDQRGPAGSVVMTENYVMSFDSPIVDPEWMGEVDPLHPVQTNAKKIGSSGQSRQGTQVPGIMFYVRGQSQRRKRRLLIFSATLQGDREGGFKREQNKVTLEFNVTNNKALNTPYLEYIPNECG